MNYPALALAASLFITVAGNQAHAVAATSAPTAVSIDNYTFKAPITVVTVGAAVVWKNLDDDPHTVTATDGSFDSKGLAQGDTFTYRFTKAGRYSYYCKVHPMMRGTIVVKEKSS